MKLFIYFLFTVVLLGVNYGLFSGFSLFGAVPNFLLILLVVLSLSKPNLAFNLSLAVFSGLLLDFSSRGFFGGYTFAFIFLAFGLYLIIQNFFILEINWKLQILIFSVSFLLISYFVSGYGLLALGLHWTNVSASFQTSLIPMLIGILVNLVFYFPIRKLVLYLDEAYLTYFGKQKVL